MADIDTLPKRGVPARALVDGNGIASNGSQTVAQLAARGMRAECAVDATGVSTSGANMLQIAQRGFRAFCPVNELGIAQDASTTADMLRRRGIRPVVLLDANGIALNGSANVATLAQRGLQSFCPLDEAGNATTMGAVILVSNTTVLDNATIGTNVGTLSVAGGTGTYTFTLTSNPGSLFATAGTNGVNLNTAAALTAGDKPITVQAAGGAPTPISRSLIVTVAQAPTLPANTVLPVISGTTAVGQTLTTTNGTWTGFPAPGFTYQWKRGGVAISGATGSTYLLVSADVGANITATVTATNSAGNASATSAALGPVTGPPMVLTAAVGIFPFAGEDMVPVTGYALAAAVGMFPFAGQNATLTPPAGVTRLTAAVGAFPFAGQNATLTVVPAAAAYTGPGDVSGWGTAYGYWGLRGYNSTKLSGTTKCLDVCSNQTGAALNLTTVFIGSNGYVDLSGIGFSPIYVHRIYDQVGSPAQDLFQSGARSQLITNAVGGKPSISFTSQEYYSSTANAVALAQPVSMGTVFQTSSTSGIVMTDGSFNFQAIGLSSGFVTQYFGAGPFGYSTFVANTLSSLVSVANGASCTMWLNGAVMSPTTRNHGTNGIGTTNKLTIGGTDSGSALWTGSLYEFIIKSGVVSDADKTALSTNQHAIGTGW